jgi:hypothetical protein
MAPNFAISIDNNPQVDKSVQVGIVDDSIHRFIAFEAGTEDEDEEPGGGGGGGGGRPTPTLFNTSSTASFSNFVVKPGVGDLGGDVFEFDVTITNTSSDPNAVLTAFAFQSKFSESPALGSRIGDKLFFARRVDNGEDIPLGSVKKNAPAGGLLPGSSKFISINSSNDFPEEFNAGEENEALEFGGARFVDENGKLFVDPTKGLKSGESQTIRLALDFGTDDGALVRVPKGTITGSVIEDPVTGFPVLVDGSGNAIDIIEFTDVKVLRKSDGTFSPSFATLDAAGNLVLDGQEYITLPRPNFAASDILGRNHTRSDYGISGLGDETEKFSFTDVGDLIPGVLNFEALLNGFGEDKPFVPAAEYYIQTEDGLFRQLLSGSYDELGSLSATISSTNAGRSALEEVPEDFSDDGPRQPRSGPAFGSSARTVFSDFQVIADDPTTIENEGGAQGGDVLRFTMEITNTSPLGSGIYLTSFGYQTKQQGLTDVNPEFDGFTQDRRDLRGAPNGANLPIATSLSDINTYNEDLDIGQFPNSIGNTLLTAKLVEGADPNKLAAVKKNGPFPPILAGNSKFITVKSGLPASDQDADENSFGDPGTLSNRLGLAPGESQKVTLEMDYGDFRGLILELVPGTLSEDSPLLAALTPEERANFGLLSVADNRDQRELEYAHPDVVGELIGFLPGSDATWLTPETLEEIIYITLNQPGNAPTVMNFGENFGQILGMAGFVPAAEFYKPDNAGNLLRQLIIGEYLVSTLPGDLASFEYSFISGTNFGEFSFNNNILEQPNNKFQVKADKLSAFSWTVDGIALSLLDLDLQRSKGFSFEKGQGLNLQELELFTSNKNANGDVYRLLVKQGNTNDVIEIGAVNNHISTGDGNDRVFSSGNISRTVNTIDLGDGNNTADVKAGDNTIFAGTGNDVIRLGAGNDTVAAGDGNNQVFAGEGNNFVATGTGDDSIYGGSKIDVIHAGDGNNQVSAKEGVNLITAGNGNNKIYGGSRLDIIITGQGKNEIYANEGSNIISAGNGGNLIHAGSRKDAIRTGSGNDTIYAGEGDNYIDSGKGDDTLYSGSGRDFFVLHPGLGFDTIINFNTRRDKLGLTDGLTVNDLTVKRVSQGGYFTEISVTNTGDVLARLQGVHATANQISWETLTNPASSFKTAALGIFEDPSSISNRTEVLNAGITSAVLSSLL